MNTPDSNAPAPPNVAGAGADGPDDLLKKKAAFVQHSLPGLAPGKYTVTVQQSLHPAAGPDRADLPGNFGAITRTFGVDGPRHVLARSDIHSVYPPADSSGEYSNSLAHVVLAQEKLPWLRSPHVPGRVPEIQEHHYTEGGQSRVYDGEVATWLMVLLLGPSDLEGADPRRLVRQGSVRDLVPDSRQVKGPDGTPVAGALDASAGYSQFSYCLEAGRSGPVDPGIGVKPSDSCAYIDLPASLWNALAPSLADLEVMAHVREVAMTDKPIAVEDTVPPVQRYAVVMGNRLPESFDPAAPVAGHPAGQNVALLVSLASMQHALRERAERSCYDETIADNPRGFVRLVVLHHWSFTSRIDESARFEDLLRGLNGRSPAAPESTPLPNPLLRYPDPPKPTDGETDDRSVVRTMLELGYVPMNHITRAESDGEPVQTVSWYRGPLVPFELGETVLPPFVVGAPGEERPTVFSADKLLRFDPNIGMYDASYAAAWQLGRSISLADSGFSVPLFRWRKELEEHHAALLEARLLEGHHGDLLTLRPAVAPVEAGGRAVHHGVYRGVVQHLQAIAARKVRP